MIEFIDTITGTPCPLCGEPIGPGFGFAGDDPETGAVICNPCWLVTEPDTGK